MWKAAIVAFVCAGTIGVAAQGRGAKTATLAVVVSDPDGAGIPLVVVSVEGPAQRAARTEGGRIVFEAVPAGLYRLRFEHERFVTLERELTARAGAPTEVKVTLNPVPAPPVVSPADLPEEIPDPDMKAGVRDLVALIEAEYVGRGPSRVSQITCEGNVESTLIQLNESLQLHVHERADEVFYVIAGTGTAQFAGAEHPLKAGTYVFVPRGTRHSVAVRGRNPLMLLSSRTGEPCNPGAAISPPRLPHLPK
jgi:mannose-6-phosphate isomerase-like protein (cupin superfamily)